MIYLDYNATTPVEPAVADLVLQLLRDDFGNAGSRTHEFGLRANRAVQLAREQIAYVVNASPEEIVFTSGATESDNLALLGLEHHATATNRRHVVSTTIEHKAVLEPLAELSRRGFDVTLVGVDETGRVDAKAVLDALRPETILVSVMHANNETGTLQPIHDIATGLRRHDAYFHVDASQTFGKASAELQDRRIDFISISGHKVFAPKGVGALVTRRRGFKRPPLRPLLFGGGQEAGLRPGTLAVPLIAGFGLAATLADQHAATRAAACATIRQSILAAIQPLAPAFNGDQTNVLPHVLNVSIPGIDSEAAMVVLKDILAISNGSACTSHSYAPSHVLAAMGLPQSRIASALRFSWAHNTPTVDWDTVVARLAGVQVAPAHS